MLDWMVWTTPTALFFASVATMLIGMSIWGHVSPPRARVGFLGVETDRGDRLYVALISIALFLMIWIATTGVSLGIALVLAAVLGGVILRWA